ncbi:MAG: class I SAM-dependent methyltransferase [Ignavibacteria bacterium]|nr:class I SAM-dependent methyltransferase [Ignavibacteria bacterium]
MNKVKHHYDSHLGYIYPWMTGDFEDNVKTFEEYFASKQITPRGNKIALDLGSGHGIQSIALSNLGFNVTSIDFSNQLLDALKQNSKGKVKVIEGDIMDFDMTGNLKPELIVCMGDTLTHLTDRSDLRNLLKHCHDILQPGGKMVLSFRDLTKELEGAVRFIPVQSSEDRILTCFLEYHEDRAEVYDILHEKIDGKWEMKVSSYPKLRITSDEVCGLLFTNKLRLLNAEQVGRMEYIIADKNS